MAVAVLLERRPSGNGAALTVVFFSAVALGAYGSWVRVAYGAARSELGHFEAFLWVAAAGGFLLGATLLFVAGLVQLWRADRAKDA